jgi:hypothetical protein
MAVDGDSPLSLQEELLVDLADDVRAIRRSVGWLALVVVGGFALSVGLWVLAILLNYAGD